MVADLYLIPSTLGAPDVATYLPAEVIARIHRLTLFFAEDLRSARRFIKTTGYPGVLADLTFYELSEHTGQAETEQFINILKEVGSGGLLSEAGLPAVADPGSNLVHLCHIHGISVHPLTGPSSLFLALMASGFNGQQFTFHGYLPRDPGQRRKKIRQLEEECNRSGTTQIFMEAPYRNNPLIKDILDTCHDNAWLSIGAALTTTNEFVHTMQIIKWKTDVPDLHKIPAIFILGKPG